jgi:dynein heavy chain 2
VNIQIVCSMNPTTTVGRHPITTRFTAIARLAYMPYVPREEMSEVYAVMFGRVLRSSTFQHNLSRIWASTRLLLTST